MLPNFVDRMWAGVSTGCGNKPDDSKENFIALEFVSNNLYHVQSKAFEISKTIALVMNLLSNASLILGFMTQKI